MLLLSDLSIHTCTSHYENHGPQIVNVARDIDLYSCVSKMPVNSPMMCHSNLTIHTCTSHYDNHGAQIVYVSRDIIIFSCVSNRPVKSPMMCFIMSNSDLMIHTYAFH